MTAAAPPVSLGGGRLRYLDGYRGVAALAVLAFHVSGRSQWFSNPGVFGLDGGAWMERLGNFAVCVFFLLSGLVLYRQIPKVKRYLAYLYSIARNLATGRSARLEFGFQPADGSRRCHFARQPQGGGLRPHPLGGL